MMKEVIYIYHLVDPRTDKPRYVGQTNWPEVRRAAHMFDGFSIDQGKRKWIADMKAEGFRPQIKIVRRAYSRHRAKIAERREIRSLLEAGHSLLNIRDLPKRINGETLGRALDLLGLEIRPKR